MKQRCFRKYLAIAVLFFGVLIGGSFFFYANLTELLPCSLIRTEGLQWSQMTKKEKDCRTIQNEEEDQRQVEAEREVTCRRRASEKKVSKFERQRPDQGKRLQLRDGRAGRRDAHSGGKDRLRLLELLERSVQRREGRGILRRAFRTLLYI
jgi:Flp pilus assembly protein TadB